MVDATLIKQQLDPLQLALLDMGFYEGLFKELHRLLDNNHVRDLKHFAQAWNQLRLGERNVLLSIAYDQERTLFLRATPDQAFASFSQAQQYYLKNKCDGLFTTMVSLLAATEHTLSVNHRVIPSLLPTTFNTSKIVSQQQKVFP